MNLGDRAQCKLFLPNKIGHSGRRVEAIIADSVDTTSITLNGSDLTTTLTNMAGGSLTADWDAITS